MKDNLISLKQSYFKIYLKRYIDNIYLYNANKKKEAQKKDIYIYISLSAMRLSLLKSCLVGFNKNTL